AGVRAAKPQRAERELFVRGDAGGVRDAETSRSVRLASDPRVGPRSGSCASSADEPRQGRKAAALSRPCAVPQALRAAVGSVGRKLRSSSFEVRTSFMSHIALARKWRPQRFEDVIGQRGVVETLKNAISSGRLAQSFIFAGPRGVGKTTTARILARALNCVQGPTPEPCGKCDACIEISEGRDLDVLEIDG